MPFNKYLMFKAYGLEEDEALVESAIKATKEKYPDAVYCAWQAFESELGKPLMEVDYFFSDIVFAHLNKVVQKIKVGKIWYSGSDYTSICQCREPHPPHVVGQSIGFDTYSDIMCFGRAGGGVFVRLDKNRGLASDGAYIDGVYAVGPNPGENPEQYRKHSCFRKNDDCSFSFALKRPYADREAALAGCKKDNERVYQCSDGHWHISVTK